METYPVKDTLYSFIIVARMNHIHLTEEQLNHSFALENKDITENEILLISKNVGLRAKAFNMNYKQLSKATLPALVMYKKGAFAVVGKITDEKVLILNQTNKKPEMLGKQEFEEQFSNRVILIKNKDINKQRIAFGLKWFVPSIVKYKNAFIDVLIASFSLQIMGLISPLIMQVIIDKVLVHKGFSTLTVLMVGLMIIVVFEMLMNLAKNYVFTHTTNKIDVILSSKLFEHLLKLPLRYFEVRRVGETIARVREVENVRRFLTGAPLSSILDVLFLIIYILVMFMYSVSLTQIVLISLPFFVILSLIVTPILKSNLKEKFKYGAEMQSFLVESVSGIQTIKSFALEPLTKKRWEDRIADYVDASFKTAIIGGTASTLGKFIQRTSDLVLLWVGTHLVISQKITVGQFIAFRMLAGRVSAPILRLVNLWQDFQQTSVSIERLGDIFNTQVEQNSEVAQMRLPDIKGNIIFQNINFRYRLNTRETIKDLSISIKAGEKIGIIGRSGSGKSTLSKLLQRLYIPESGKITIDGVDLSLADPYWLRRQIGVVLQENFLFNGSVFENICIHKPGASLESVVHCSMLAGAHDFILELPEGYDTQVGEKGCALSGGQRQRIAIARALLTNPKILIFDEATSALDYESENIIQQNIQRICQGRTVLIIAHRLSTTKDCDKIIVMDEGSIVETGSHSELMDIDDGLYRYLYTQQDKIEVSEKIA